MFGKYLEITFWAHYCLNNTFPKWFFIDTYSQLLSSKTNPVGHADGLAVRSLDGCIVNIAQVDFI